MGYVSMKCVDNVDKIDLLVQELINTVDVDFTSKDKKAKEIYDNVIEIRNKINVEFDNILKMVLVSR